MGTYLESSFDVVYCKLRCFLCSTQVPSPPQETGGGGGGEQGEEGNSPSSSKILFQYLLSASEDGDFKEAMLSSNSLKFCDNCKNTANQIEALHLRLEKIQRDLTDKLKQVKNVVTSVTSRKFHDWLDQLLLDGRDCELELCRQFHAFIRDNDKRQIRFMICVEEDESDDSPQVPVSMEMDVVSSESEEPVPVNISNPESSQQPLIATTLVKEEMDAEEPPPLEENETFDLPQESCGPPVPVVGVDINNIKQDDASSEASNDSRRTVFREKEVRLISCDQCPFQTPIGTKMEAHLLTHETEEKPFICLAESDCSAKFSLELALHLHLHLKHSDFTKTRMECDLCGLFVKPGKLWKNHLRRAHAKEKLFECDLCGNMFANIVKFIEHSRLHPGKKLKCPYCPNSEETKLLTLEDDLLRHLDEIHEISDFRLFCPFPRCSEVFYITKQLHRHRAKCHPKLQCADCKLDFATPTLLHSHRLEVHQKFVTCDLCPKLCANNDALTDHKISCHAPKKQVECPKCPGRLYACERDLKNHENSCHPPNGESMFKCSKCPEEFKNKFAWDQHVASHEAEPDDSCSKCGVTFTKTEERWQHLKCMTLSKPANNKFPSLKAQLKKKRERRKTKKPRFHCDLCPVNTATEDLLKKHKAKKHNPTPCSSSSVVNCQSPPDPTTTVMNRPAEFPIPTPMPMMSSINYNYRYPPHQPQHRLPFPSNFEARFLYANPVNTFQPVGPPQTFQPAGPPQTFQPAGPPQTFQPAGPPQPPPPPQPPISFPFPNPHYIPQPSTSTQIPFMYYQFQNHLNM